LEKHIIDAMAVDKRGLLVPNSRTGDMWIKLVFSCILAMHLLEINDWTGRMAGECYPFSLEDLEFDEESSKYKLKNARRMEEV
jgi:hypothetical protein